MFNYDPVKFVATLELMQSKNAIFVQPRFYSFKIDLDLNR